MSVSPRCTRCVAGSSVRSPTLTTDPPDAAGRRTSARTVLRVGPLELDRASPRHRRRTTRRADVLGVRVAADAHVRILLDNALRFTPADGRVRVTVDASEHVATIAVTDNGPGIAHDERDVIFDRFRRGRAAGGDGGFGLGLAIGRELAQRMGGDLRLTDHDPGARFELLVTPAPGESG